MEIHGGGGSTRSWPEAYLTGLSRDFMVIVADSRGQGNSTDGAGPITYGRLAFDAVRLLDHLGIARAHIVGHSSGAVAGLYFLVHFPDRVKTATLLGAVYHVNNFRPEAYGNLKRNLELISFPDAPHRVQVSNSKELIPAIRDFITRRGKE